MNADVITLSDPGATNPRRVAVTGVQCSWELGNVGTASLFARLSDLRRAGLGDDLVGMWLQYVSRDGPPWGGVITEQPIDDGIVELTAEGWGTLLGGQVIDVWDRQALGQPAALVRRALTLVGGDVPLFLTLGTVEEGGDPVSMTFGGQRVLDDALPELAEAGELEWVVDQDRVLHVGRRIGRDKSATIRLVDGRHVIAPQLADGVWTRPPARVYTIESDEAMARRLVRRGQTVTTSTVRYVNPFFGLLLRPPFLLGGAPPTVVKATGSVTLPELSAGVATWPEQPPGTSTHSLAIPPGKGLEPQTTPCQLTVVNRDDLWRRVDLGDVVRLEIGSAGFSGWFRLIVAALDTVEGVMTWAGEALADTRAA